MLFSSLTFVFIYLPAVLAIYFAVRPAMRNGVLLLASLFFYAWGEPRHLAIMLLTIGVNYAGARLIAAGGRWRTPLLALTVLCNLSFLGYFKYFNFFVGNLNSLFSANVDFVHVLMPIGISFYTFQAISYVIDVYRGETPPQRNIWKLALYIVLFPQLVAGPIVKYHDIAEQIDRRTIGHDDFLYGVRRFIIGLAKKVLIANTIGSVCTQITSQPYDEISAVTAWIGLVSFAFQVYYDFSGYSDMAIGLGTLFGFRIPENFNYPLISRSIGEFWRRWHISLSTWFKEYLYIPLGGNRSGELRTCLNLFIVFLVTGFWHGASWNMVLWGAWHGMFIVFERLTRNWWKREHGPCVRMLQHLYAMTVFVAGFAIFLPEGLKASGNYIKAILGLSAKPDASFALGYYIGIPEMVAFAIALICCMPVFKGLPNRRPQGTFTSIVLNGWFVLLFVLSFASMAASTYNPFIYFRF